MHVLGFGTYDRSRQPRAAVLLRGLSVLGCQVTELNRPLGFSTADRVAMLHHPWRLHRLALRLLTRWVELTWRRARMRSRPDVVLVGYLAQFDVVLARLLFPRSVIVLDLLVFADDTARDRGVSGGVRVRLLQRLDRLATACADVIVVDTSENLSLLRPRERTKAVVAPVGALEEWFQEPRATGSGSSLRVIFFGLYTPLQGAPVIGEALAMLPPELDFQISMVGTGQDFEVTRAHVGEDPRIAWIPWVPPDELPALVARHHVCLGIFGTSDKALRVVPTKVYEGAASGCALLTSDTRPQRRTLDEVGRLVPPGDPAALADALAGLVADPEQVAAMRASAFALATRSFRPQHVARPLWDALRQPKGEPR